MLRRRFRELLRPLLLPAFVVGQVSACSLLAPDDDELFGRRRPDDGDASVDPSKGPPDASVDEDVSVKPPGTGVPPPSLVPDGSAGDDGACPSCTVPDACAGDASCNTVPVPTTPKLGPLRLELHCGARTSSTSDSCHLKLPSTMTSCPAEGYMPEVRAQMQGEPGKTYTVTLKIRGVVEPKTYKNGTPKGASGQFYAGGERAGDPIYNSYGLDIDVPSQRYFLNNWPEGDYVLALNYDVNVQIATGAWITLYGYTLRCAASYDCEDLKNVVDCPYKKLDGVTHLADHGQFVQIDLVKTQLPTPFGPKDGVSIAR